MNDQVPGGVDPGSLPEGHPMKVLATKLGIAQQTPQGGAPVASQARQPVPAPHLSEMSTRQTVDPLGRPYALPSGGLLYPGHGGTVILSPMRGEQEETLAGAGSGLSATPALRHVVEQCVDCQGIAYESLLLEDWSAILLHILALSLGADTIPLYPACPHCNTQFDGSRPLSQVPCRVLMRAGPGEPVTWPPSSSLDEDEDLRILREMGLAEGQEDSAHQVFACASLEEPVEVTLSNGQTLGWRYLRLSDLAQAEQFAERSQDTSASTPGAKLHSFISARYIATIDGRGVGVLEAMRWVKQAPMSLIMELRSATERRSFGYEFSPTFRCPNGHGFRQELPLNAAMFRGGKRAAIG